MRAAQLALLLALVAVASAGVVSKRSIFRNQPSADIKQWASSEEDEEPQAPADVLPPGPPPRPPSKEKTPASQKDPPPSKKDKPPKSQETPPASQKKPPPPKEKPPKSQETPPTSQKKPPPKEKPPKSQETPPAPKEKPPKSQETPPASQKKPPPKEKPPKSQETPPASQKNPPPKEKPPKSQEKPPASKEKPPAPKEKPTKSQEKPPASKEKPPKSQEKSPKSQEKLPKSQEKPPKSQEKTPKSQEKPPKSLEKQPKSQEKPPKSQEKPPKSQEKPPKSQEKPPKSQDKPPKSQEKPPKSQEKPPKSQEKPPKSQEKPPKSQEKPPKSQEKPPKSQEKPPKSQEKPPKSQEKPPKSQEKPPKSQEKPPKSQEKPPKSHEKPPKSQEKPPKSQEKPPKSQEKPPKSQEKPPKSQEKPPKSQEKPPKSQEKPPKSQEKPPKSQEKPPKSQEKPPKSQEKPPKSQEKPPKSQEKPSKSQEKPPKSQEKPPKSQEKPPKSQEKPPKSQEKPPKSQEKPPKSQEKPPKSQEKPPKSQEKPPKSQEKPPKSQEKPPKSQEKPPKSRETSKEQPPVIVVTKATPTPNPKATTSKPITPKPTTPKPVLLNPSTPLPSQPPVKDETGCGACRSADGRLHRVLPDRGCAAFSLEVMAGEEAHVLLCPQGYLFDAKACGCRAASEVKCPAHCLPTTEKPKSPEVLSTTKSPAKVTAAKTTAPLQKSTRPPQVVELPFTECGACNRSGVRHSVKAGEGCKHYYVDSASGPAGATHTCNDGYLFDPFLCYCNYDHAFKCPSKCDAPTPAPQKTTKETTVQPTTPSTTPLIQSTPSRRCGSCLAGGVQRHVLAGEGCKMFTDNKTGNAITYVCANDLLFDPYICECNYPHAFSCPAECGGDTPKTQPPKTASTTVKPTDPSTKLSPSPLTSTAKPLILSTPRHDCGSCVASDGVTHRVTPGGSCKSFTKDVAGGGREKFTCPDGRLFDPILCMCNYPHAVSCPHTCDTDAPPTEAPKPTPSASVTTATTLLSTKPEHPGTQVCDQCTDGGDTFTVVSNTECASFIKHKPGKASTRFDCASDLVFDTKLCACNWKAVVTCAKECGGNGQPPTVPWTTTSKPVITKPSSPVKEDATSTAVKPTIPATKPSPTPLTSTANPILLTTPRHDCGSCTARDGVVRRVTPGGGCKSFTKDVAGGDREHFTCPDGRLFDPILCMCNYPHAVRCPDACDTEAPPTEAPKPTPSSTVTTVSTPPPSTKPELPVSTPAGVETTPKPSEVARLTVPPEPKEPLRVTGCGVCSSNGAIYRPLPNSGCRKFTEEAAGIAPMTMECPAGLLFDTEQCVCNYDHAVYCPSDCGSEAVTSRPAVQTNPPPIVMSTPGRTIVPADGETCGVCRVGDTTYEVVIDTGCTSFVQRAPGSQAQRIVCPEGLIFDTNQCVCNWKYAVQCPSKCGGRPPDPVIVTSPPQVTSPKNEMPPLDLLNRHESGCGTCHINRSTYRAVKGTGCRAFMEESENGAARRLECPKGLVFDTTLCICNYEHVIKCTADCSNIPNPPADPPVRPPVDITDIPPRVPSNDTTVIVGCGQCLAGGNIYRTIAESGCMAFTEEAPGIAPRRLLCPDGLVFDTNQCVCNWREAVTCLKSCEGRPPADAIITSRPIPTHSAVTQTTRQPQRPEQFIPQSGCGVCKAKGNTYRALPGCRSFTEESSVAPPRKLDCAPGFVFDTTLCFCNYECYVKCASDCSGTAQPPTQPPVVVRPPTETVNRPPVVPSGDNKVTSGCGQCQAGGNTYRTVSGSECKAFTEEAPGIAARRLICPDGLVFDTNLCVCNWRETVQCSSNCQGQPPIPGTSTMKPQSATGRPPTVSNDLLVSPSIRTQSPVAVSSRPTVAPSTVSSSKVGCGQCEAGGSIYRVVGGTGCTEFTVEAQGLPLQKGACAHGLLFDTNQCVCNWPEMVQCSKACHDNGHPPALKTEIATAKPPVSPAHTVSSCGVCKTGCTVFRVLEEGGACNTFMQETEGLLPVRRQCSPGLAFDAEICTCSWQATTECKCGTRSAGSPSLTDGHPMIQLNPRPNEHLAAVNAANVGNMKSIPSGCGTCQAHGVIFRTVPSTGCAEFTMETSAQPPARLECNSGLAFDIESCRCDLKEKVKCTCVGDGKQ